MNFAYFFTTAAALCFAQEFESDGFKVLQKYKDFKLRYSIEYSDSNEDAYRFRLFRENVALIEETNRKNLSYTMGINKFTGMTKAEFAKHMVCKKSSLSIIRRKSKELFNSDDERFTGEAADLESHLYKRSLQKIPTSINWAQKGAVNPSVCCRKM
ncbi:hypothetical protein FOL47_003060 [Perkinsus chesapeaki]|uniref:Cathepsin propeptide inhibitor domain-containing protein n=1 Tax=Perkinsus chesapeaki TaxID=330153 RepID=A0A7J6MA04_PERCH|nr:hypothetical protein FOL47_003060 [Perkinsus chesapeaki]